MTLYCVCVSAWLCSLCLHVCVSVCLRDSSDRMDSSDKIDGLDRMDSSVGQDGQLGQDGQDGQHVGKMTCPVVDDLAIGSTKLAIKNFGAASTVFYQYF